MALCCLRYFGHGQLPGSFYRTINSPIRFVQLKAAPVKTASVENYDERNARLKRPQSPHLSIYKPQLTAIMSISHRMTGMAMGVYITTLGVGTLISPVEIPFIVTQIESLHLNPVLILAAKSLLALPVAYHLVNGVRHLAWDFGKFLTIKEVYLTGYITLAATIAFTAYLASL